MNRLPLKLMSVSACLLFSSLFNSFPAYAQSTDAPAMRTWHASSGGFKVEAELVDVREGKVQLKKSDGSTLWVPLDKLSLSDVKHINAELAKARQAIEAPASKPSATKPSATKPSSSKPSTTKPGKPGDSADKEPASEEPDAAVMTDEPTDPTPNGDDDPAMSGDADDVATSVTGRGAGRVATRSPFAGMKETNLVLGQVSPYDIAFPEILSPFVAVRRHGAGGQVYTIYNIRTGKSGNPFTVEGSSSQWALSSDGATLVTVNGFPQKIAVYATASGKKQRDLEVGANTSITTMFFISPSQLLINGGFQMPAQIYDVKSGKVAKTMDIGSISGSKYAISPDGKWLAFPGNSLVSIFDLKAYKLKNQIPVVPNKGSKSTSLNIHDLSFCSDGTELAVLCSGTSCELQLFSMKTFKPVLKHTLTEQLSDIPGYSQYRGPCVETIPNNKGYILYGGAIVDRQNGGPIWVDKPDKNEQASPFRVLIDDQRQLKLIYNYSAMHFDVVKLPWSEIAKSKDHVAKGGTVEDSGLPQVKQVASTAAKSVDGSLNPKPYHGTKVDVEIAAKPKAIPVDRNFGHVQQVKFASPKSGLCVTMPLAMGFGMPGDSAKKKSALVIDLNKGEVEKSIDVEFLQQAQDVSPGGKWLVGTTGQKNDRVDVFNLTTAKHELGFRPGAETESFGTNVLAQFLTDDILLTSVGNKATAWEFPALKPLYKFSTLGLAFRFPSSPLFMHRNEQGWYVRNARDGRVEGTLENASTTNVEFVRTAHFRADESAVAVISGYDRDQRLIVWDLLTGKRTCNIPLSNLASARVVMTVDASSGRLNFKQLGNRQQIQEVTLPMADSVIWTGDNQLLMRWMRNDRERFNEKAEVSQIVYSLFNLENGRMLWDYRVPVGALVEGGPEGQLWFVEYSAREQLLVGTKVPTKEAMLKIAGAPQPKLLIPKGSDLMVDMQVSISGNKLADDVLRDQVVAALVKKLAAHEVDVDERAGVKLTILVNQVYGGRNDSAKIQVVAILTDISNNLLWQRESLIDGQKGDPNDKPLLAENLRRAQWESTLDWIRETVDPADIYEKWYYRGIGESLLSGAGEKIVELKAK